jgi:hypothetical protein
MVKNMDFAWAGGMLKWQNAYSSKRNALRSSPVLFPPTKKRNLLLDLALNH